MVLWEESRACSLSHFLESGCYNGGNSARVEPEPGRLDLLPMLVSILYFVVFYSTGPPVRAPTTVYCPSHRSLKALNPDWLSEEVR